MILVQGLQTQVQLRMLQVLDSDAAPAPVVLPPPTVDQTRWDGRDAQAHALIALSVKRTIIPHIWSCKSAKDAWNTLARCTRLEMKLVLLICVSN